MGWSEVSGQTGVTQVWLLILAQVSNALNWVVIFFTTLFENCINRGLSTDVIHISIVKIFLQVQWKLEIYIMVSSLL